MYILDEAMATLTSWADMLQQTVQAWPLVLQGIDAASLAIPLATLLACVGLCCLSGMARLLAVTRKRSSYAKCARQLALLAVLLGWSLLVGGRLWLFYTQGTFAPDSLANFILECAWMLLGSAVMLVSVYYMLWKPMRGLPTLHALLAFLSGLAGLFSAGATMAAARLFAALDRSDAALMTLEHIYTPDICTPFFCALCMTLPLALALAGGFGAFWLILRRRHDDFGRDHYNAMLPWCAVWARNAWIVYWLLLLSATSLQIHVQWLGDSFTPEDALWESAWLLLWLVPALFWAIPARSATPLRHKLLLFLALLLSLAGVLPFHANMTEIAPPLQSTTVLPQASQQPVLP
ncbi:MAG: hypothetical protein IJU37_07170 [Desulfovibrio sp.]|nr:hypothetical protein [Desulfovibrio sp.]